VEEERTWQVYVASCIWGCSQPYFQAILDFNSNKIPGNLGAMGKKVKPSLSSTNLQYILAFGLAVTYENLLNSDIKTIIENPNELASDSLFVELNKVYYTKVP
jgi:hypothetical protein